MIPPYRPVPGPRRLTRPVGTRIRVLEMVDANPGTGRQGLAVRVDLLRAGGWPSWCDMAAALKTWDPPPTAEELAVLEAHATTPAARVAFADLMRVLRGEPPEGLPCPVL